jgi:hypothetical protein
MGKTSDLPHFFKDRLTFAKVRLVEKKFIAGVVEDL